MALEDLPGARHLLKTSTAQGMQLGQSIINDGVEKKRIWTTKLTEQTMDHDEIVKH